MNQLKNHVTTNVSFSSSQMHLGFTPLTENEKRRRTLSNLGDE